MRLLDLFCGAGGCSEGYRRAGFTEIVGIDIKPQPRYPFTFIQADALRPPLDLSRFDLVHASPPCQAYSALNTMSNRREHPMLVEAIREMLQNSGVPWVIENVFGAPLLSPVMLCGSQFGLTALDGYSLQRHRYFESSLSLPFLRPACSHGKKTVGVYGAKARDIAKEKRHYSKPKESRGAPIGVVLPKSTAFQAMGIGWMNMEEISEAIPPAYTQWIGERIIESLRP